MVVVEADDVAAYTVSPDRVKVPSNRSVRFGHNLASSRRDFSRAAAW